MKRAVGGVLVLMGLCMDGLGRVISYAGQGISYTGRLIEDLGNHIGDPV